MQQPSISPVSLAIALYCSALKINSKYKHFTTTEWEKITETLKRNHLNPSDLLIKTKEELLHLGFTDAETERLLGRAKSSVSLGMALSKLYSQGVNLITRADPEYPHHLKSKLGQRCPPLFYAVGATSLLNADTNMVGVVGSRDVSEEDSKLTRRIVSRFIERGYTIVSGGAKGIDSDAINQALELGGSAIIFTSDPLLKQLRNTAYTHAMCQQRLVILSAQNPDLGFSVGYAMQRNRYIYTQAHATLVVKSSLNGGTWEGANDCLKRKYAPVLCIQSKHDGNQALISNGAIPVTEQWDGAIEGALEQFNIAKKQPQAQSDMLAVIEAAPTDPVTTAPSSTAPTTTEVTVASAVMAAPASTAPTTPEITVASDPSSTLGASPSTNAIDPSISTGISTTDSMAASTTTATMITPSASTTVSSTPTKASTQAKDVLCLTPTKANASKAKKTTRTSKSSKTSKAAKASKADQSNTKETLPLFAGAH